MIVIACLFIAMCTCFWSFTAEDAFIVYRYAENCASGEGLAFNQGERVSALTSPLHALLTTSLFLLSGQSEMANKLAGMTAVLGAALLLICSELKAARDRLLAAALILLSPFLVLWTVGGLETPFLIALVMTGFVLAGRCCRTPELSNALSLSIALGLMVLTRFDAVLFAAPSLLMVLVHRARSNGDQGRRSLSILELSCYLLPGALIVGGWLIFAHNYYHDLLPTSFYHKRPEFQFGRALNNLVYIGQLALLSGGIFLLLARFLRRSNAGRSATSSDVPRWGHWLGLWLMVGYALSTATTHMMFSHRMLLPYLPVTIVLLLQPLAENVAGDVRRVRWVAIAIVLAGQVTLAVIVDRWSLNPGKVGEYQRVSRRQYVEFMNVLAQQADAIEQDWKKRRKRGAPRIFTYAAGVVAHRLPQAHILDGGLISYRHAFRDKPSGIRASADYVLVLTPRHGNARSQLGADPAGNRFLRVISIDQEFDGAKERFEVYFNVQPSAKRLSPAVR